jgi:hypothetical protein
MNTVILARLHDAEVTGLSHDAQCAELTLQCRCADGTSQLLIFWGVKAWRFSEFEEQNVVFAFKEFDGNVWRESEEGREDYYQDVTATIRSHDLIWRAASWPQVADLRVRAFRPSEGASRQASRAVSKVIDYLRGSLVMEPGT